MFGKTGYMYTVSFEAWRAQNAIVFYTCICQCEVSQNFTEEIIEQKLKFSHTFYACFQTPRSLKSLTKVRDFLILTAVMWLYLASENFEKNIVKKYQKQQLVSILWQILRPKPAMLPNFWDHLSIANFFQSFFVVLRTGLSAVRKYM